MEIISKLFEYIDFSSSLFVHCSITCSKQCEHDFGPNYENAKGRQNSKSQIQSNTLDRIRK